MIAFFVERLEKRDEFIDLRLGQPKRMNERAEEWIAIRAAVVELDHPSQRSDRSVVHVGRVSRDLTERRCLERAGPRFERRTLGDSVATVIGECLRPCIPADAEIVEPSTSQE